MTDAPVIRSIHILPVSFPLVRPFVTAAGGKTKTDNVQVVIKLSNGLQGRAEASSSIAMPSESQTNMSRVLHELGEEVRGQAVDDYKELVARIWRAQPYHPTATAALESAILDAHARWRKQPLFRFFGGQETAVETDLTLSVAPPDELFKSAEAARHKGFKRFKVKLAGNAAGDIERLRAVRRAAPRARLVADGNQGFSLSQALQWAHRIEREKLDIVFFEQPFPRHDLRSMRQFRHRAKMPVFADEAVLNAADALKVFNSEAADGVNVKVAKSGLLGALDIITNARRLGKRLAIGCMEESKVGLAASVHLACGTGAFEWIDLDSVFLIATKPPHGGFSMKGPVLSVKGSRPGIGL